MTPAFAGSIKPVRLTGDGTRNIVTRRARRHVRRHAKRPPTAGSRDGVHPLHMFEQAIAIRDGQLTLTPDVPLPA